MPRGTPRGGRGARLSNTQVFLRSRDFLDVYIGPRLFLNVKRHAREFRRCTLVLVPGKDQVKLTHRDLGIRVQLSATPKNRRRLDENSNFCLYLGRVLAAQSLVRMSNLMLAVGSERQPSGEGALDGLIGLGRVSETS